MDFYLSAYEFYYISYFEPSRHKDGLKHVLDWSAMEVVTTFKTLSGRFPENVLKMSFVRRPQDVL